MYAPAYGDEAPIAALATPPGESALTLIRTSGKDAPALAAPFFSRPEKLLNALGNTVVHGWIMDREERLDEALVSVFRAPRSYTGEDALDICCHGGRAAAQAVLGALKKAGFRDALPGEFTFRAFMNGKLDLTRAESVMELVSAKTSRARQGAVGRLSGSLEREIREIKTLLVEVLAETELYLDYSEDETGLSPDIEARGLLPNRARAEAALARLEALGASYTRERLYHDGALAVIAGRPNAGKSSLFNLLLGEDRAIVADVPGTTRDWIEAWIAIEDIPLRLADTAGLRDGGDPLERLGMERSRDLAGQADLILYVLDGAIGVTRDDQAFIDEFCGKTPLLLLWNKADLRPPPEDSLLGISAKTGAGLPRLSARIAARLREAAGGKNGEDSAGVPGIGTARQEELVRRAEEAAREALALAAGQEPLDVIAPLLREGISALGEITGEVSTADILEAMFSRFCVGK